jgi:hypothetical protein
MIEQDLAKSIFKQLDSFGRIVFENKEFSFNETLKPFILESVEVYPSEIKANNRITIEVRKDEFMLSLLTDFYFGLTRINEQIKNVDNLLNTQSQVSWIITTTYYACYFMAVELAKLHGQFIMNFSKDEFNKILSHSRNTKDISFLTEINNSFKITVSHSESEQFLFLTLIKDSSKPHQIVWINLHAIISKIKVHDNIYKYQQLILDICNRDNTKWRFPSDIRNEWNYARADYYGSKGNELGKTFCSIIREYDSTIKWAGNNTIRATPENVVASISYVYHILTETIHIVKDRLQLNIKI